MIIKEMHGINEDLDITLDDQGCMVIQADREPSSWTIMVKDSTMSTDGWYWVNYAEEVQDPASWQIGNPPIFDLSAATNDQFPVSPEIPQTPDPLWELPFTVIAEPFNNFR